ncbi:hypothetical protein BDZ94DRAFT_1326362 [Collybia nuda]|uniref:Uncharacterized protein n=1 Tax=Collybia nuda TaxID=64659 RepID=A0A9P5XX73_9AGAR|nr:hypothetical protein BDZ94DRAFT_1326362 [Collybia nuda]
MPRHIPTTRVMGENQSQVPMEIVKTRRTLTSGTHSNTPNARYSRVGPKIPREICSHIIDYIDDKRTVLSMLVTFKAAHSQAERKLYHNIKLTSPTAHKLFLDSILDPKRPYLAPYVRRYSLANAPVIDHGFNTQLTSALGVFVNLKYLSFWGLPGYPSTRVLPTEIPCPFQLHTFHWGLGTHDYLLEPFLKIQKSLEVLWLLTRRDPPTIPSSSLRNLRSLGLTTKMITNVVPGHDKITCLQWEPDSHQLSIDATLISPFSHIRILSFGILRERPSLWSIVFLLEHLEVLELGGFQAGESIDLYKLTYLQTLVIGCHAEHGLKRRVEINIQEAFDQMACLERIDLEQTSSQAPSITYERWVRAVGTPTEVNVLEVIWWRELFGSDLRAIC